jgi:SapC
MSAELPPGYQSLAVLDKAKHRNLGVRAHVARFAASLQTIYLTLTEFVPASRHYPIVFARDRDGCAHPFVIAGTEAGHHRWVDANGDWRAEVYCPAYVRRYPFWTAASSDSPQSIICVDEHGLDNTAPHLFDQRGEPTPRWREILKLIEELDTAQGETLTFCRRLDDLQLLEPVEADINPVVGPRRRLGGMLRVDEPRLRALPPATLAELANNGYLPRIYAHLMSHDNFHLLLDPAKPSKATWA